MAKGVDLRHRIRLKELPRIIETAYEKVNNPQRLPTFEKSDVSFPLHLFPEKFQRAAKELSRFIQIDFSYVAMAMLAAYSIAMGNKVSGVNYFVSADCQTTLY